MRVVHGGWGPWSNGVVTDRPHVPEVLPLIQEYVQMPGHAVGGNLHVFLDDGNLDNSSLRFCRERARERADSLGAQIANLMLRMTRTQRRKLCALAYH